MQLYKALLSKKGNFESCTQQPLLLFRTIRH